MKQVASFILGSSLTYSLTLKIEVTCSSQHQLTFNGLHRIKSQNKKLFITTAVRTTNPKKLSLFTHTKNGPDNTI
jgi:hypothetical protein